MKIYIWLTCLLLMTVCCSDSCQQTPSADTIERNRQEAIQMEMARQINMPDIHDFSEKKFVKYIYEQRDNPKLINYAYTFSEMTGTYKFLAKCMGYGLPYSTQYSSPEKLVNPYSTSSAAWIAMPQAEPNGLFMPSSAEGTWLILIDPSDNLPKLTYFEPRIIVSSFKLPVQ